MDVRRLDPHGPLEIAERLLGSLQVQERRAEVGERVGIVRVALEIGRVGFDGPQEVAGGDEDVAEMKVRLRLVGPELQRELEVLAGEGE